MNIRALTTFGAVALLLCSLIATSSVALSQAPSRAATLTPSNLTITQFLARNSTFSTFASLLNTTNLTKTLDRSGTFTVFAPTNAAFAKVNKTALAALQQNSTQLKRVLRYHIVNSTVPAANLTGHGALKTLAGPTLPYTANKTTRVVRVDNATILQTDIKTRNGVVHVIDSVMTPPAAAAKATTATATASKGGFLGLPGFEAVYAVAGLLAATYLVIRRKGKAR